jgi:hypothetical protein
MNEGLEHRFYVPSEYWDEWYKIVHDNNLSRFALGSTGVENGIKKNSDHWNVQANLRAEAEGLPPRENLLLREFK